MFFRHQHHALALKRWTYDWERVGREALDDGTGECKADGIEMGYGRDVVGTHQEH